MQRSRLAQPAIQIIRNIVNSPQINVTLFCVANVMLMSAWPLAAAALQRQQQCYLALKKDMCLIEYVLFSRAYSDPNDSQYHCHNLTPLSVWFQSSVWCPILVFCWQSSSWFAGRYWNFCCVCSCVCLRVCVHIESKPVCVEMRAAVRGAETTLGQKRPLNECLCWFFAFSK